MENQGLTPQLWRKALAVHEKYIQTQGKEISREKLAEILGISESTSRGIVFALRNLPIIKSTNNLTIEEKNNLTELVMADLHIPYHDSISINAMFDYLSTYNIVPDVIVILGDLIDFYKVSFFSKDPTKMSVKEEMSIAYSFLQSLRADFPDARIIYYEGNHEQRLNRYLMDNAGELYELVQGLLEDKLRLNDLRIEYIDEPFRIGKLWHLHGHEKSARGGNPEYITNVMWKYVHDNFIVGHYHRSQEKMFKAIDGTLYWGGAVGHLATTLEYAKLNNWTQGFGIIHYDINGDFIADLKTIHNGEVF